MYTPEDRTAWFVPEKYRHPKRKFGKSSEAKKNHDFRWQIRESSGVVTERSLNYTLVSGWSSCDPWSFPPATTCKHQKFHPVAAVHGPGKVAFQKSPPQFRMESGGWSGWKSVGCPWKSGDLNFLVKFWMTWGWLNRPNPVVIKLFVSRLVGSEIHQKNWRNERFWGSCSFPITFLMWTLRHLFSIYHRNPETLHGFG